MIKHRPSKNLLWFERFAGVCQPRLFARRVYHLTGVFWSSPLKKQQGYLMFKRNRLALGVSSAIVSCLAFSAPVMALDVGALPDINNATVKYGSALIGKDGAAVNIDASGSTGVDGNTLIQWGGDGFNVGRDGAVNFTAQSAKSIILNHDVSGKLSVIDGNINSNQGNIVIVNPNGIEHTGGGNAQLSLIAGNPTTEDFGLSKSDNRIEVTFDQTAPLIRSHLENMDPINPYGSSWMFVEATGILQMHSNAGYLRIFGGADGNSSSLSLYNSDFLTGNLYLYGLGIDARTVEKTEMPTVSVINSKVTGTDSYALANSFSVKKSFWNEADLTNKYGASYNYNLIIADSDFKNLNTSSLNYGTLKVTDSTFSGSTGLQATDFTVIDSTFTGNSQFDGISNGINATPSFTFERNTMLSPNDGNWSTSYVTNGYGTAGVAQYSFADNTWRDFGTVIISTDGGKNLTFNDVDELRFTESSKTNVPYDNITYNNSHLLTMYNTLPVVSFEVGYDDSGFNLTNSSFTGTGTFTYFNNGMSGNYLYYVPDADYFSNLNIKMDGDIQFSGRLRMYNVQVDSKAGIYLKDTVNAAGNSYIKNSTFKTSAGNIYTTTDFQTDESTPGDINFVNKTDGSKTFSDQSGTTIAAPYCNGAVCINSTTGELSDPDSDESGYANYYHQYDNLINKGDSIVVKTKSGLTLANTTFQIGDAPVVTPPDDGGGTVTPPSDGGTTPPDTGTTDPVDPPVVTPVDPPVVTPVDPPVVTPVDPPVTTPVDPPVVTPVDPPVVTPVDPPVVTPVDPPVTTPVEPPVVTPIDPPVITPVDPPVVTPVDPPVITPVDPPVVTPVEPPVVTPEPPVVVNPGQPPVLPPAEPVVPPKSAHDISVAGLESAQRAGAATQPDVIVVDQTPSKEGFVRRLGLWFGIGTANSEQRSDRIEVIK